MTLIASGTGYIEFFLRVQAEGNSQRELTIGIYTISAREQGYGIALTVRMYMCVCVCVVCVCGMCVWCVCVCVCVLKSTH